MAPKDLPLSDRARGERELINSRRQLAEVRTLGQYRTHLARDLADLPLAADVRRGHLGMIGDYRSIVAEDGFWAVLEDVHRKPGGAMANFGHEYYLRYQRVPPMEWTGIGARIVAAWSLLRGAPMDVSSFYRRRWNAGHAHGLLAMMRADGVRAVWVQRAITELQDQQQTGSPEEQQRATDILLQMGPALAGAETVGGERAQLDRAAIEAQRAANRRYKREGRNRRTVDERLETYLAEVRSGAPREAAEGRAVHRLRGPNRERLLRMIHLNRQD